MLALLITLACILTGVATARKVRTSMQVHFRTCTTRCGSQSWTTTKYKDMHCSCGARDGNNLTCGKFWLITGAFFLFPLYILGWFVISDSLPRLGRKSIAEKTAELRVKNDKMTVELDDIERRLAAVN